MSIDEQKRERSWYYWKDVVNLGDKVLAKALVEHFTELFSRVSKLEAAAEKAKQADEEIERDWEALVKRLNATPLQPKVEPTAPPQTRKPGWYWVKWYWAIGWEFAHFRDGSWRSPGGVDTHGNRTSLSTIERVGEPETVGPRIQEPSE